MKRILVVEDEDVIRDFEVINLKRSGYEVVDVPSGEEALQIFDRNPAYFDVAVLDVMMPGIDGFEVCRRIREKNSSIGIRRGAQGGEPSGRRRRFHLGFERCQTG